MTTLDTPWSERTTWAYDGISRLATLTLANGATTTYAYDAGSRVTGIRHAKAGGTVIAGFQYTRDAVGNPTGVSLADGNPVTYSYALRQAQGDRHYWLAREARSGTGACLRQAQADRTYTFDAVGNRTTKQSGGTTTTYTFDEADRLTVENSAGSLTTYSWDAAGNNTVIDAAGTLTTYTWDLLDRLTAANAAGTLATFTYSPPSPSGRGAGGEGALRRTREDAGGLTRFLWDGQTLLEELDSGGSPTARYVAPPGSAGVSAGGAYGPIVSQRRGATSHFLHGTDLGTIEALTDTSGDVTDTYVNTAFGVSTAASGSTVNPHRFVGALGYYTDPLGPVYVRARWLRPGTGSWLSADPVLSEPRYQYVGSRASWATDGSGLVWTPPSAVPCVVWPGSIPWPILYPTGGRAMCMSDGRVISRVTNPTCSSWCSSLHELSHSADLGPCCLLASACISRHPEGSASWRACIDAYNAWERSVSAWTDCRAYQVGLRCRAGMYVARGCGTKRLMSAYDCQCCVDLYWQIRSDRLQIQKSCSVWGAQLPFPPFACPFTSNGDIVPR